MDSYLYLGLNLFAIAFPFVRSFEPRIHFASKWFELFPAIGITAIFFIVWDHWFTLQGVWEFNTDYLLGIFFYELPIEEWLFFITIPYACIFIYEVLIYFFPKDIFKPFGKWFVFILVPIFVILGLLNLDKLYTSVNFFVAAGMLTIHYLVFTDKYMGRFIFAYLVHLIPFIFCNGILTGGLTKAPVVIYNNAENLGIRIWTVPIEDTVYSLTLLLMNVTLYEFFKSKKQFKVQSVEII